MTLNKYQKEAMTTCMPSSNNFAYMFYNFLGEVAELIEKVNVHADDDYLEHARRSLIAYGKIAKEIRKNPTSHLAKSGAEINKIVPALKTNISEIVGELGDCEWQLNGIMTVLGLESEYVHEKNLKKLASRQLRGLIDGNGDNR